MAVSRSASALMLAASALVVAAESKTPVWLTPPPLGPTTIFSTYNNNYSPRHCQDYASIMPMEDGNDDFSFVIAAALNGNAQVRREEWRHRHRWDVLHTR